MAVPAAQGSEGKLYARLTVSGAAATDHARWASIDAVRALAALMVLASHAYQLGGPTLPGVSQPTHRIVGSLAGGVWLFFSASGFLIAGPFLRSLLRAHALPRVGAYALRRTARIIPAYWLAFATILVLVTGSQIMHWWQVPVHGLLLHRLVPRESERLCFVAWTLGVEAIFYALVPIAAVLLWRFVRRPAGIDVDRLAALILGLWASTVVWGLALALAHPFGPHKPMPPAFSVLYVVVALGNFCPGMLIFLAHTDEARGRAGWWARYRSVMSRPALAIGVAVALLVVAPWLPWRTDPFAYVAFHLMFGILSGLVLGAVLGGTWVRPLARVLAPFGLISYGLYLWHWVVLSVMREHRLFPIESFGPAATVLHITVLFALTVPFAFASWMLLERPLLRRTAQWDRRRAPRQPGPQTVAVEASPV